MKKILVLLLVLVMVLSMAACGGSSSAEPTTEPATEATTEPIPDIAVYAKVPEDWKGIGCWAWQSGGEDAFEAWPGAHMTRNGDWYEVNVPGWIDSIIINGQDGDVQTADLAVESGKDLWIHVVSPDYAFVHYEEPAAELLEEELAKPAQDYSDTFHNTIHFGDYQVADTKAVTYHERLEQYTTDYIPEELQTDDPTEVYYVIFLKNKDQFMGYYFGLGGTQSAIKPGIQVQIKEIGSDKILAESDVFEGSDPPDQISLGHSGRGLEPDSALIEAWILSSLEKLTANPPAELPFIPLNQEAVDEAERAAWEAMSDAEKQAHEAKELAEQLNFSHDYLVEWLVEYEGYTQEEAETAADNCGADWKQLALQEAEDQLARGISTYENLVDWLVDICQFTREEAIYAADNCSADWNAQARAAAQVLLDDQADSINGYYSYDRLVYELVNDLHFTQEDAAAFADTCGQNWKENAKLQAQWLVDREYGLGYSEQGLRIYLQQDPSEYGCGFSQEEADYAMQFVKVDWAQQAVLRAAFLIEYYTDYTFTKEEMITELTDYYGFTEADATYAAEQHGLK